MTNVFKTEKQPSSKSSSGHRNIPNYLRILLGLYALWLTAGTIFTQLRQDGSLIEADVYKIVFFCAAVLMITAVFLPVFRKAFQRFFLFRMFSLLIGGVAALLLGTALLVHTFVFFAPKSTGSEPYVIVLGAPVAENQPTANLRSRVETAAQWLRSHPEAKAILTGGNGDIRTGAKVMFDLLTEAGIPAERLLIEDQASTTEENFQFSKAILQENGVPEDAPVAVITNEFHIYRARYNARQAGVSNLRYIPAHTSAAVHFGWFARETISIIRNLIIGNLFHI